MQPTLRDPNPPLTRSVEDYLKAIYHLSSQGGFAATSDIAAMLEVAPPSVSGMVKRLSETGLDRKSTRLNSSHGYTPYAVFCLQTNRLTEKHRRSTIPQSVRNCHLTREDFKLPR